MAFIQGISSFHYLKIPADLKNHGIALTESIKKISVLAAQKLNEFGELLYDHSTGVLILSPLILRISFVFPTLLAKTVGFVSITAIIWIGITFCSVLYTRIHGYLFTEKDVIGKLPEEIENKLKEAKDFHSLGRLSSSLLTNNSEIAELEWLKVRAFARKLSGSYHVFAHGMSHTHGVLTDFITHLDPDLMYPAFDFSWDFRKKFRAPGCAQSFKNTESFFKSDMGKSIKNRSKTDDDYPSHILSCDGYLNNRRVCESAYDVFSRNRNIGGGNQQKNTTLKSAMNACFKNDKIRSFSINNIENIRLMSTISNYHQRMGRVYIIAIEKQTLMNKATNYAWRAHPFGRLCTCHGNTQQSFIQVLKDNNQGTVKKCLFIDYPQYRLLAGDLDADKTKKVFTLSALSEGNKNKYAEMFWPLASALKQCQRLESLSLDTPKEEVLSALLRTRLELPLKHILTPTKKELQENSKTRYSENIQWKEREKYSEGILEILQEKEGVFQKHQAYLEETLPQDIIQKFQAKGLLREFQSS